MRQRMWRQLFAAAAGVFVLAGAASAQYQPPPLGPGASPVFAQPAPGPTIPSVPAAAAPTLPGKSFYMAGGYYGTNCQYGSRCNNGCGSLSSDLGFMFGPCKSFMAPCGPGPANCGRCLSPLGRGPCGPFNPCFYDSYGNH